LDLINVVFSLNLPGESVLLGIVKNKSVAKQIVTKGIDTKSYLWFN